MFRQIVVLGILLAAMFALKTLGVAQTGGVPLFLASVGFVLLAAYSASEIAGRFRLPKVTGYILAGVILGPGVMNILSTSVVEDIKMFSTLALGLIALNAGLELRFESIRQISKTLMATIGFKIITLGLFVGGGFFLVQRQFQIIATGDARVDLALAMVFAALSIGTSPAIALAVTNEAKSKGRMTDLVLGMAVAKDLVVVLVLALVLALSVVLTDSSGESANHTSVVLHLVMELGLSLLAGGILGGLLMLYLHFVRREMLLFVAATILGVAELSAVFKLELLLVFIIAGMVVVNFSKWEGELHRPLEKMSLPVFIVFFTNAGAALDLSGVKSVGLLALLLFVLRAIAYYFSSRWGGKLGGESPKVTENSWLAYIPQAGVTLGLVGVAAHELPALAGPIELVGMGMVALNLLVGPVTLRQALQATTPRSGREDQKSTKSTTERSIGAPDLHISLDLNGVLDDEVQRKSKELFGNLEQGFDELIQSRFQPLVEGVLEDLKGHLGSKGIFNDEILDAMEEQTYRLRQRAKAVLSLYQKQDGLLLQQSSVVSVDYRREHSRWQEGDTWSVRIKKLGLRGRLFLSTRQRPVKREVPLQSIMRYHLCPVLSQFCWAFSNNWIRSVYHVAEEVRKGLVAGNVEDGEIWEKSQEILDGALVRGKTDYRYALAHVSRNLSWSLNMVGSPLLKSEEVRFSLAEPEVSRQLHIAEEDVKLWEEKFLYVNNTLRAHLMTGHIQKVVDEIIEDRCLLPLEGAREMVHHVCGELKGHILEVSQHLKTVTADRQVDVKVMKNNLSVTGGECLRKLRFKSLSLGSYRLLNRDLTHAIRERLPVHQREMEILSEDSIGRNVYRPQDLEVISINLDNNFHESVLIEVLPLIESRMEKVFGFNESLAVECEDALNVLEYSLESMHDCAPEEFEEAKANVDGSVSRAIDKITDLENEFLNQLAQTDKDVHQFIGEANAELWKGLHRAGVVDSATTRIRGVQGWVAQKWEVRKRSLGEKSRKWGRELRRSLKILEGHEEATSLRERIHEGRLDAQVVRKYLKEHYLTSTKEELPRLYHRLFSLDPLQDRRFFSAHREALDVILGQSGQQLNLGRRILVTAEPGMGRTSLLNICQLEFPNARIVRVEQDVYHTTTRILPALGAELGTDASINNLLRELRRQNMVVMIDNLDNWLQPSGYEGMERFCDLIVRAPENVTWIATIRDPNYTLFQDAFDLRSVFTEVVRLKALDGEALRRVIYDRHKLSGLELEFASSLGLDRLKRIWKTGDEHLFFSTLKSRSHGNLRLALALWIHSLEGISGDRLQISLHKSMVEGFGFLGAFSESSLIILKELYRYGPRTIGQLRESLIWDVRVLRRELSSLEATGLVVRRDRDGRIYQIPADLTFSIGSHFQETHWL